MSEFIFRLPGGEEVGRASDIDEFLASIEKIPTSSIEFHIEGDHFSTWLRDNGYVLIADKINAIAARGDELRSAILKLIRKEAMIYRIYGLEYLGRTVDAKNPNISKIEAKRFVVLKAMSRMPSMEEVIGIAKANPAVKKAWVMEMHGNKWRKVMDKISI